MAYKEIIRIWEKDVEINDFENYLFFKNKISYLNLILNIALPIFDSMIERSEILEIVLEFINLLKGKYNDYYINYEK